MDFLCIADKRFDHVACMFVTVEHGHYERSNLSETSSPDTLAVLIGITISKYFLWIVMLALRYEVGHAIERRPL